MRTFFEEIFADRNPRLFGSNLLFPFSMPLILILSVHFPLRPPQFSCLKAGLGHGPSRPAEPLRPAPCGHRADASVRSQYAVFPSLSGLVEEPDACPRRKTVLAL
jgi:hypothetical protein